MSDNMNKSLKSTGPIAATYNGEYVFRSLRDIRYALGACGAVAFLLSPQGPGRVCRT